MGLDIIPGYGLSEEAVDAAIAAAVAAYVASVDPRTTLDLVDDFATGTASTGDIGDLGWTFTGGTVGVQTGEADHPGLILRSTSATISTYAPMILDNTSAGSFLPAEDFDVTFLFRPNTVDADTIFRFGLGASGLANPPNNGIYIERLGADTNWFGVTRAASSETRANLGVAVSVAWFTLRIRRVDASTVGFSVNGGAEVTATATIPTVALNPFAAIGNLAAADKTMTLDWVRLLIPGLSR